jgi:hypothetical protein
MAESPKDSPKLDLTRIEDFDPTKEPQGPDVGTLLGLEPAVDPTAAPGTDQLLAQIRSGQPSMPPPPPPITQLSIPPMFTGSVPTRAPEPTRIMDEDVDPVEPAASSPMSDVKRFSEQLSVAKELVPAAFPFSVMIDGMLAPEEKERLLDLLNRENLGIRPMDLEPQLEEGRVLIPRVSEFAGVMIVQALRSSSARIRIGPSDDIFATDDTRADTDEGIAPHLNPPVVTSYEAAHAADRIPVTPEASLPELGPYTVIDIVTASAGLSVQAVEAVRSTEYQELLEALQKELRFKAWRKGATAVLNFSVQLNLLTLPSRYRVLVTGSAVRSASAGPS